MLLGGGPCNQREPLGEISSSHLTRSFSLECGCDSGALAAILGHEAPLRMDSTGPGRKRIPADTWRCLACSGLPVCPRVTNVYLQRPPQPSAPLTCHVYQPLSVFTCQMEQVTCLSCPTAAQGTPTTPLRRRLCPPVKEKTKARAGPPAEGPWRKLPCGGRGGIGNGTGAGDPQPSWTPSSQSNHSQSRPITANHGRGLSSQ